MNPPAGWNPDPFEPSIDRYWDGQRWTGETRPNGIGASTRVPGAPGAPVPDPEAPAGKRKWPWIAGAAGVAMAGFVAIGVAGGSGESEGSTKPVVTSSTTVAATTTKTTTATTTKTTTTTTVPPTTTTTVPPTTTTVAPMPLVPQVQATTTTPYVPPAPAYTPPKATEPAYVPPAPSGGTVHPGSYCSSLGATGVTTKGTAMVCGIGSDGKKRWKSAG
ncbi:hypothetical protein B2J88_44150 [Rhodococcus sp. SRB_17]|nr:hypothetical protein [Rhodococcus sp. SRB_17]